MDTAKTTAGLGLLLTSTAASGIAQPANSLQVSPVTPYKNVVFSRILDQQQLAAGGLPGELSSGVDSGPTASPLWWTSSPDGKALPLDHQGLPLVKGDVVGDPESIDSAAHFVWWTPVPALSAPTGASGVPDNTDSKTLGPQPAVTAAALASAGTATPTSGSAAGGEIGTVPGAATAANGEAQGSTAAAVAPGYPWASTAGTRTAGSTGQRGQVGVDSASRPDPGGQAPGPAGTATPGIAAGAGGASDPGAAAGIAAAASGMLKSGVAAAERPVEPGAQPVINAALEAAGGAGPASGTQTPQAASHTPLPPSYGPAPEAGGQLNMQRPGWGEAVVDKLMWMSARQLGSAEIQLDPPELGPLQLRVSTQHEQTSVTFSSHHPAVRDALDAALPRLRDMLESQGLQLVDVDVSGQDLPGRQQAASDSAGSLGGVPGGDEDAVASLSAELLAPALRRGLVDEYA